MSEVFKSGMEDSPKQADNNHVKSLEAQMNKPEDRIVDGNPAEDKGIDYGLDVITKLSTPDILRPELVVTKNLSAIAIPRLRERDGHLVGEWLHMQSLNGERRCIELLNSVEVVGDYGYRFSHIPEALEAHEAANFMRWSPGSRSKWLSGKPSPSTSEMLQMVVDRIDRYIVFQPERAKEQRLVLAAWVMMTYVYPALPAVPYLCFVGPRRSGKSRAMDLLSRMVFRPTTGVPHSNFHFALDRGLYGGAYLLDDAHQISDYRDNDVTFMSILLAGQKAGVEIFVYATLNDQSAITSCNCYGPVAVSIVDEPPSALHGCCIHVPMQGLMGDIPQLARSLSDSRKEEVRVRDALHCWALEHAYQVATLPLVDTGLTTKDAQLWAPLLQIAADTEGDEYYTLLNYAREFYPYAANENDSSSDWL